MTAQDLKNSILQRAIEGKLVPQRQEEGTAKELLAKIRAEKARLIKEKKIKKSKPLPVITDDEKPFDIPESWEWVRLGEVSTYGQKINKIVVENMKPDMWLLDMEDIEKGTGRIIRHKLVKSSVIRGDKAVFHKGDLLYSKLRPYLKKILIAPEDGICTSELVPFQVYQGINPLYAIWWLHSPSVDQKVNTASYGVKMPRVGKETMINLLLPLPPLAEQHRIVAKIEELLPDIDAYDKAQTKVQSIEQSFPGAMKKSLLQYAIEGKLVPQRKEEGTAKELLAKIRAEKARLIKEKKIKKDKPLPPITDNETPFDIPDGWEWARVGDIVEIINGDRGKNYPSKSQLHQTGDIPFISAINIQNGTIEKDNLLYVDENQYDALRSGKLSKGDIVLCIRGSLGKNGRYPFERGAIASSLVIIRSFISSEVFCRYFSTYLSTGLFQDEINRYNNGTAQPNLGARDLMKFLFPLPPLAEQHRMVARLEELLPLCDALAAQH